MKKNLFTIVMEFDGGTFISQSHGHTPEDALQKWCEDLDSNTIQNFGPKSKDILVNELLDCNHNLVLLDGMINVWCTSHVIRGKLMLINVIKMMENTI
jgi:hypothetical protein